jgi:hypothetical protein
MVNGGHVLKEVYPLFELAVTLVAGKWPKTVMREAHVTQQAVMK